jgi:hypothetical protein
MDEHLTRFAGNYHGRRLSGHHGPPVLVGKAAVTAVVLAIYPSYC